MALTSSQKHYLKRNWQNKTLEQMSMDLGLPEKEVSRHLKKIISPEKYRKISGKKSTSKNSFSASSDIPQLSSENIWKFIHENIYKFILLFFLVFISYYNAFDNDFVSDDIATIRDNADLGSWHYITSGGPIFGFIQRVIYSVDHGICGLSPSCFRANNFLFHLGSVFLIFIILSFLFRKPVPLMSAVIFSVHPILTEPISWVSGLPYVQYSFFFFASFLFYLLGKEEKKYRYLSIFFFIVALFSSEKAIALFLVFPFYEFLFGSWKKSIKTAAPYLAISLAFLVLYLSKIGGRLEALKDTYQEDYSGYMNPLQQIPVALSSYLKLIFWPHKLTLYQTEMTFTITEFIFYVLGTLILFGLIAYGWKKNRQLCFWLSFFIITLLPTLTPLKIAWIVAERYAYIGSLGIFIAIALFISWIADKAGTKRHFVYYAFAAIILSLSIRTIVRNFDWQNEDALWTATAKTSPSGQNTHNNMGDVYARRGQLDKAIEEFKKSTEISPNYADPYFNLGAVYMRMGRYDDALANYQKAIKLNPDLWQSYQDMSAIYFNQGKLDLALENAKKAAEFSPNDPKVKENLRQLMEKAGK